MVSNTTSTIRIALLTPPGRGALAAVGVHGPGAADLVKSLFTPRGGRPLADRPDGTIVFGRWGDPERGEELVVVRHAADHVEVHCHGGVAASAAVLASLEARGAVPGAAFQLPSQLGGGRPSRALSALALARRQAIEAEARGALARVGGPRAARILCRQLSGTLADELDRIDSLCEAGDRESAAAALDRLRQVGRVGLRLVDPWRVVLSGPVNAGKSSLVNALAGYARSIVSAEPGTTRDVVTTRLVLGGWEIDLIDTAGLREPGEAASATERAGIERAMAAAGEADLVLCINATSPEIAATPSMAGPRNLRVASKADLAGDHVPSPGAIPTSAITGEGLDALAAAIVRSLVPETPDDSSLLAGAVPFTNRQMALIDALEQGLQP